MSEDSTMEGPRWQNFIVSTPDVLHGKPRLKDTRIPVSMVLGFLAAGATVDDVIAEYPDLSREHVMACLSYARDLAAFEADV
jgi:uncharacterized protein (DUF433 family)